MLHTLIYAMRNDGMGTEYLHCHHKVFFFLLLEYKKRNLLKLLEWSAFVNIFLKFTQKS